MDFTELFFDVDDFCNVFQPLWEKRQLPRANAVATADQGFAQRADDHRHCFSRLELPRFKTLLSDVVVFA